MLLVGVVIYLGWQIIVGRDAIAALTPQWDTLSVAGAVLAAVFAYQCLFLAWLMLLSRSGYYKREHFGQYVRIWWVSYLYRYVPGKVMLLVERARMGSAVGIPPAAGAALTIIETLLAILAGSAVSLLAVSYYAGVDNRILLLALILAVGIVLLFPAGFRMLCATPAIRRKYPELEAVALGSGEILVVALPFILHYLLLGASFFLISSSLSLFSWSALPG